MPQGKRRSMVLTSSPTLAAPGPSRQALDPTAAEAAAERHISNAYRTRLMPAGGR
jgi:hypothetical protein